MDMSSPEQWYRSLPIVSKWYISAVFVTTILANFGFINLYWIAFDWDTIWKRFQIWRLFTGGLYLGTFSFGFVFNLMMIAQYSPRYELAPFYSGGSPSADYLYMLILSCLLMAPISYFLRMPFYTHSLIFVIIYVWSRKEAEAPVSFFSFRFKALYLPWVLLTFSILTGGSPVVDIIGIAVGHGYYFLVEVLPVTQGYSWIKTPLFLQEFVDARAAAAGTTSTPPPPPNGVRQAAPPRQQGHQWGGSGYTLGSR